MIFVAGHDKRPDEYPNTARMLRANHFTLEPISPPWGEPFRTLATHVRKGIAELLPDERPIVLAHSLGGNLALMALAKTRRKVGGMIIASNGFLCANGLRHARGQELVAQHFPGQEDEIARYDLATLAGKVGLQPDQVAVLLGKDEAKNIPGAEEMSTTVADAFGIEVSLIPNAPHFIEYSEPYIERITAAALNIHQAATGYS